MPFIDTKMTKTLSEEKEAELRRRFGKAIELLPGKTERWLMLNFTDGCRMAFSGDAETPCAMMEVKIFGSAGERAYAALSAELTRILSEETGIRPDRIYVKYEECEHWGLAGSNF